MDFLDDFLAVKFELLETVFKLEVFFREAEIVLQADVFDEDEFFLEYQMLKDDLLLLFFIEAKADSWLMALFQSWELVLAGQPLFFQM